MTDNREATAERSGPRSRAPVTGIRPIFAILLLQLGLAYLILGFYYTLTGEDGWNRSGNVIGVDFIQYYAASSLALEGNAAGVYDRETLYAAEAQVIDADVGRWPWSYPPTFLLAVYPFAKLPYLWALALWLAVSLALLLIAGYRMARHPWTPALFLFFPAVGNSLFSGQNGCLSAALIAAALLQIERRPWLAGLFFGLLSYKPQLGLLIPLALLAAGYGRVFVGAAVTTILFAGLSILAFGLGPWQAFFDNLGFVRRVIEDRAAALENMPTLFSLVHLPGGGLAAAYTVQIIGVLAAAGFVVWLWRAPVRQGIKSAGLLLAFPLSTPYAQFYDLAMLAPAALWWCLDARDHGWIRGERPLLMLLWVAPVLLWVIALYVKIQLWPLLLIAALVLIGHRARRSRATPPAA